MLHNRTHQAVERLVSDEKILKLIEADDGEPTVGVVQRARNVQQLQQRGASLVRRRSRRTRGHRHTDPAEGDADREA